MKLRPYQLTDKDKLIALWRECGLLAPQNDPSKDIERKLKVDPDLFLVGVIEDNIVASIMGGYEGHRGWVNYLAVKPSQQRKGLGQQLMQETETLLKQKGCPKINLQVRTSNPSVIAFYEAIGYANDHVVSFGKRLEQDA